MKKYIIILLLLLPSLCFGASTAATIMGKAPTAISTIAGKAISAIATVDGVTVAAAPSYLIQEGAEGSGTPSGWSDIAGGTVDWDYATSPAPIEGTQSLRVASTPDGNPHGSCKSFTATDPVYGFFEFIVDNRTSEGSIFLLRDGSDNQIFELYTAATTYYLSMWDSAGRTTTTEIVQDTKYYLWWDYAKGTGANGVLHIYLSTTTTKPAATITVTDSAITATAAKACYISKWSVENLFDNMVVSASDITGVP